MAKKSLPKINTFSRTPSTALKTYSVYFFKVNKDPIYITANFVEENDTSLVFKIIYESSENYDESEEVVAIFKDWDFFVLSSEEAAKI